MRRFLFGIALLTVLLCLCACNPANPDGQATPGSSASALPSAPPQMSLYSDILADYRALVEFRLSDSFESDWNSGNEIAFSNTLTQAIQGDTVTRWLNMIVDMKDGLEQSEISSFGYLIHDIGGDATPELFWLREDGTILAVFTVQNDRVLLLDAFWPRYRCVVSDENWLYTQGSSGAAYTDWTVRELTSEGNLRILAQFGTDGESPEAETQYYEIKNATKVSIGEERFQELTLQYPFEMGTSWNKDDIQYLQ